MSKLWFTSRFLWTYRVLGSQAGIEIDGLLSFADRVLRKAKALAGGPGLLEVLRFLYLKGIVYPSSQKSTASRLVETTGPDN